MLRPSHQKVRVRILCTIWSCWNALVFSSTVDLYRTGGWGGVYSRSEVTPYHLSLMLIQNWLWRLMLHQSRFFITPLKEGATHTEKIWRRRNIGFGELLYSFQTAVLWYVDDSQTGITVRHIRTELLHQPVWHPCRFLSCLVWFSFSLVKVGSVLSALVDSLEALCVFHRHEELLSQVVEGLVGWQIQTVETEAKKFQWWF